MVWKKWLFRIAILFISIIIGIALLVVVKKDAIQQKAIDGLNNVLNAEVSVQGEIDITFLSTFPHITLELEDVFLADKFVAEDTLASIQKVNFELDLFSLWKENIAINTIDIANGNVFLKTYPDGKSNFDIIKAKETKADSTKNVTINLEEINVSDVYLVFDDRKAKVLYKTNIDNAQLAGQFQQKDFDLNVDLETKATFLKIARTQFLNQNNVEGTITLFYTAEQKCFEFKENSISIDENSFELGGTICAQEKTIDLLAKAKGDDIENALKLVPKDLFDLQNIKGSGKYEVFVSIKDKLSKPAIQVGFQLENAKATLKDFPFKITDVYTTGTFSNTPRNQLIIKDFDLKANQSQLKGSINFPNLKEKKMKLKAEGTVYANELAAFKIPQIRLEKDGKLDFENLVLDFNYRKKDSVWQITKFSGGMAIDNMKGHFLSIDKPFTLKAKLTAKANKIKISQLNAVIAENDISFSGSLQNALRYFQQNVFRTNEALVVNGTLSSKQFNINSFLENNSKGEKNETLDLLSWLNIKSNIDLSIASMQYKKLKISDVKAKIKSNKAGRFAVNNLSAKGLDGQANGDVALRFFNDKTLEVSLDSKLKNIDINKLFVAFDDFDQKTIQSKNIKGAVDANIILAMSFKNFVAFQKKDLLLQSNFSIKKGELINLEALQALSKYLSVEQLKHIYFSKYDGELKILDEVLYLKKSNIKSNILSLGFGGSHSFDNEIDYIMKLNLRNVLAAKFKKNKTLQKDYVNNAMGGINIFLSMKGTVDKPIIKMEKRAAFLDEQKEQKTIKEDVKEYFKQDTIIEKEQKEFYFENEEEEEYIDFEE